MSSPWIRDSETTIKIKFALLRGVDLDSPRGQRGKSSKNADFRGQRHDNKILNSVVLNIPSDTKLLLTENDSEVVIFEQLRIPYVIP